MRIRTADSKVPWPTARLGVVVAVAFIITGSGAVELSAQSANIQNLEQQVGDFLDRWLTERDPAGATDVHLSTKVDNDTLLPTEIGAVRKYSKPHGTEYIRSFSPTEAQDRMQRFLSEIFDNDELSGAVDAVPTLALFGRNTDADLFDLLADRNIDIKTFSKLPLGYYRVTQWDDISWTASGIPGHHSISPSFLEEQGINNMRAVVGRVQVPPYSEGSVLMVMLWGQ